MDMAVYASREMRVLQITLINLNAEPTTYSRSMPKKFNETSGVIFVKLKESERTTQIFSVGISEEAQGEKDKP
jgi:hypothetical protein